MELDTNIIRWRLFYRSVDYSLDYYGIKNGLGNTISQLLHGDENTSYEQMSLLLEQQHRDYIRVINDLARLADGLGYAPDDLGLTPVQIIAGYVASLRREAQQIQVIYQHKSDNWLIEYAVHIMAADDLLERVCQEAYQALGKNVD